MEAGPPGVSSGDLQPESSRYESLTHWRGAACLFVVAFHSMSAGCGIRFPDGPGPLAGIVAITGRLWIGVPLFFVISGYCITASAEATRHRHQRPGPGFFWRRFRRIYPPFWAWLGVTALSVWLIEQLYPGFFNKFYVPNPGGVTKWQWLGNLTLTETWRWHFTGGMENELLLPSWTLCYEEQFYALVGLALLVAPRFIFGALGLITLLVISGFLLLPQLGFNTMGTFLDGKWLMFAAGILVYYALNYAPARLVWFVLPLALGMLCAFAGPRHLLESSANEPNLSYLVAFAFAILLLAIHRWDRPLSRAKILRPLSFCGEMCYSLYLTHWPSVMVASWAFDQLGLRNPFFILFLGLPFCMVVAILLGRVFHKLVERMFLNPAYARSCHGSARPGG
jgi:peptidoglycan/LPS O-acetylase OafA/YrhL